MLPPSRVLSAALRIAPSRDNSTTLGMANCLAELRYLYSDTIGTQQEDPLVPRATLVRFLKIPVTSRRIPPIISSSGENTAYLGAWNAGALIASSLGAQGHESALNQV